ncbi:hypothetical protein [Arthrobacter gyeryongensis]
MDDLVSNLLLTALGGGSAWRDPWRLACSRNALITAARPDPTTAGTR